jgi:hypothetical protein
MTISRISNDIIVKTRIVENIINIKELEQLLFTMQTQKTEYDLASAYYEKMPEDMKSYFALPFTVSDKDIDELTNTINEYKGLAIKESDEVRG